MSDLAKEYCAHFTQTIAACDVCSKKPVIAMFEGSDFGEQPCESCRKKMWEFTRDAAKHVGVNRG